MYNSVLTRLSLFLSWEMSIHVDNTATNPDVWSQIVCILLGLTPVSFKLVFVKSLFLLFWLSQTFLTSLIADSKNAY